jgi:RND family efflux transporter MFP subunit
MSLVSTPLTTLALLAAASTACSAAGPPHPLTEDPPSKVAIAAAHEEPLAVTLTASGTVRGRNTAILTSKTTGYVSRVLVRPGDSVAAGQLLAELEANDSRASVARSRAGLAQAKQGRLEAQSALEAARAAASVARSTHERLGQLLAEHAIAQQKYDEAEASFRGAVAQEEIAGARLLAVGANIEEARAGLAESEARLEYSRIVAPFAGRVLERRVDAGALAAPGTPLFVVADEGLLRVEAAVEESRAPELALGDTASIETDALSQPVVGKVSEIVPSVDVGSRAFLAKVDLPQGVRLRPGAFARVKFRVGARARLVVPLSAVSQLGSLERVFVVQGDRAELRMVTLGQAQAPWIEVLSGLAPNERIVAVQTSGLRDGGRVTVVP